MRAFVRFMGKMPLSAKIHIRFLVYGMYQEEEWQPYYLHLTVTLLGLIPIHVIQAIIGWQSLWSNAPQWAKVVFSLYAIANACIAVTQSYLALRTTIHAFQGRRKRLNLSNKPLGTLDVLGSLIFTGLVQIYVTALLFTYVW